MVTGIQLEVSREQIANFCRKFHITQLCLFGSVLRDDFHNDSDVDVLVTFAAGKSPSFLDLLRMEGELQELFGRRVDLVERQLVEQSENYIRRRHILETAQVIYAA